MEQCTHAAKMRVHSPPGTTTFITDMAVTSTIMHMDNIAMYVWYSW